MMLAKACSRCLQTRIGHRTGSQHGLVFYGRCLLYAASRTQKVISLSSAEAEVHACSSGCSDAILLAKLLSWFNGKATHIHLYTESSGARGILQRMGVGRLRHLSCRILWLQQLINNGAVCVAAVSGHSNPVDIGTTFGVQQNALTDGCAWCLQLDNPKP